MSLLGLPAQVLDRMLGTSVSRPVPPSVEIRVEDIDPKGTARAVRRAMQSELNGHADFDDAKPHVCPPVPAGWIDAWQRVNVELRARNKAYGRASRTIGEQRGTIASLRAQLAAALSNDETPGTPAHSGAPGKPGQVDGDDTAGVPSGAAGERAPDGTDFEQRVEDMREDLARAFLRRMLPDRYWDRCTDTLRDYYRDLAGAAIDAGWLPIRRWSEPFDEHVERIGGDLASLGLLRPPRSVVVQVLTDHELLDDGACRCGWGHEQDRHAPDQIGQCPPLCTDSPLWHAEHVAAQLALQGVTP